MPEVGMSHKVVALWAFFGGVIFPHSYNDVAKSTRLVIVEDKRWLNPSLCFLIFPVPVP